MYPLKYVKCIENQLKYLIYYNTISSNNSSSLFNLWLDTFNSVVNFLKWNMNWLCSNFKLHNLLAIYHSSWLATSQAWVVVIVKLQRLERGKLTLSVISYRLLLLRLTLNANMTAQYGSCVGNGAGRLIYYCVH